MRNYLISLGYTKVNDLHHMAVKYVNAGTQSRVVSRLTDVLSETEAAVLRRGRNAKSGRQPKNSEMIDYRRATGLESLVGYLYLVGGEERLDMIFAFLVETVEKDETITSD